MGQRHETRLSFSGCPSDLARLRTALGEVLAAAGWGEEEMSEVLLAADELAANAIMHARTPFEVRCAADHLAELEVVDHDPQHLPSIRPLDDGLGGFGLRIVDRIAHRWEVDQHHETKTVRAVFARPRGAAPSP